VWWGITFGFFIIFYVHSIVLLFLIILLFYVCDFRKIGVCEMGKKACTCVKIKYNGF